MLSIKPHPLPFLEIILILQVSCLTPLVEAGPVKVFILAGQSNMEGKGSVETGYNNVAGAIGSLRYQVNNDPAHYGHLVSGGSAWAVRDDVWIYSTTDGGEKGNLTVGFGSGSAIGPELGFGNVIGDLYDDQVLLIKTAWGGKSLAVDFRPPREGNVGFYYDEMRSTVLDVLDNLATEFPDYAGQGYEIVGFGWHQGWNDRVDQAHTDAYESNLESFILDIRARRNGFGVNLPDLPFVVAETGMTGYTETNARALKLMAAQAAVADPVKYPDFEGNVAFVGTKGFWRVESQSPSTQGYHWNSNAETYYLIGDGMGRAMARLIFDPEVTKIEMTGTGGVMLTSNLPASEVVVQRSESLDPATFVDIPSSNDGNRLTVEASEVDLDSDGACFFRLRERE